MMERVRERIRSLMGTSKGESDASEDPQVANARETGGEPGRNHHDEVSTTGPGDSGEFVGRVAGNDDVGSVGETGAEARARRDA